jgi:hypothetical protein
MFLSTSGGTGPKLMANARSVGWPEINGEEAFISRDRRTQSRKTCESIEVVQAARISTTAILVEKHELRRVHTRTGRGHQSDNHQSNAVSDQSLDALMERTAMNN